VSREPRERAEGERGAGGRQRSEDRGQRAREPWRSQIADRLIDSDDLIERFTREPIRGIGQAVREFVHKYKDLGKPWYEVGVPFASNGTAMRAAPVGLGHRGDPRRRYHDSLIHKVGRPFIKWDALKKVRNAAQ